MRVEHPEGEGGRDRQASVGRVFLRTADGVRTRVHSLADGPARVAATWHAMREESATFTVAMGAEDLRARLSPL